jgi:hypothetical protein
MNDRHTVVTDGRKLRKPRRSRRPLVVRLYHKPLIRCVVRTSGFVSSSVNLGVAVSFTFTVSVNIAVVFFYCEKIVN